MRETGATSDFNGDGKADLIQTNANGNSYVWLSDGPMPDILVRMDNSQGQVTDITHKPLTDNMTYTKDSAANAAAYPVTDLQLPVYVVSLVQQSDGIGGVSTRQYSYGGYKAELGTGRGGLGFRWLKDKDLDTAIERTTTYSQQWPYSGMPTKQETNLSGLGNGGLIKRISSTMACQNPQNGATCVVAAGNRYFPYVATSVEEVWDLNGLALPTTTTTTSYGVDSVNGKAYGDATVVSVAKSDGAISSTTKSYWPADDANWVLGLLKREVTTNTTSSGTPASGGASGSEALALSVSPNAVANVDVGPSPQMMSAALIPIATGGTPGYTYSWQRIGGGTLGMTTNANGVLTVSGTVAVNQSLTDRFRVTVTDQIGAQTSEEVPLNFTLYAQAALSLNVTPAAVAVERQNSGVATTGASVTVSGGVAPFTYAWTRVVGTRTVIANSTSASPTLTATVGWGENFTETVRVTVSDAIGGSKTRDVTVRYWAPAALATPVTTSPGGITVGCLDNTTYSFAASVAASGAYPPYQYAWSVPLSGTSYYGVQGVTPNGSSATILLKQYLGPGAQQYWDGPIVYPYQVSVTDSRGNAVTGSSSITVSGGCVYVPPPPPPPPDPPGGGYEPGNN